MKWTKFKDANPTSLNIYLTDWKSVWTAWLLPNNPYWNQYAGDNPEYAWSKIPIPETPKKPTIVCALCGYPNTEIKHD